MESDYSTLCNELDNIFLECPTDMSGCAEVRSLVDAFVNKYGNEKPQLRSIISDKLDPQGFNPSISRSSFKRMIMEWIVSYNHDDPNSHVTESAANVERDVFEYDASSYVHSTPLGRFNQKFRKIPKKKLSYSPAIGFTSDSSENNASPYHEELKSYRSHCKTHNSSLENSLVKAEQKIFALEEELKAVKLHSRKDIERLKEEINQLKTIEKLYAESVNKIEKYAETLNNITKEYYRLKNSKDDLLTEFNNLEIDHQRLKDEIDSKNISLKALETWKRVQSEELVVLNGSKTLLEYEVFKLKNDVKNHSENEESLMLRIGELQSEKQKLQTELNEVMNFEKLKMVTSSPFGKSLPHEERSLDRSEENRESGISVRSELMDSLGFSSCVNETYHLPYLSVLNITDSVSFTCGATALDLLSEKSQRMEQEVQTDQIEEIRLELIEKEVQTEIMLKKTRVQKIEKEIQTEQFCESRLIKSEIGVQADLIKEKSITQSQKAVQTDKMKEKCSKLCQKGVQTDQITKKRVFKTERGSQTDVMCEARDSLESVGANPFQWSIMDNTLDCLTPTKMEIDSSLEELHRSINSFTYHGMTENDGCELISDSIGRLTSASVVNAENDSIHSSSSDKRLTSASVVNAENDSINSSSSDKSIPTYEFIRVLRNPNMSTPRLRIRRIESRRMSCLDVYNQSVAISRPKIYQKLTFSQKVSTLFAGIVSILSPGIRICMKTLVWLVTGALMLLVMVVVLLIMTAKQDRISKLYDSPYFVLKYPYGPPPS